LTQDYNAIKTFKPSVFVGAQSVHNVFKSFFFYNYPPSERGQLFISRCRLCHAWLLSTS